MNDFTLPPDSYWTKGLLRNRSVHVVLRIFLTPYFKIRNRFHYKKYKPQDSTFLLLTNHNSTVDHFLNAIAVKGYIRFVVSDHLLRKGFLSKLLRFLVNPIPRRKAVSGENTVRMIQQNLRLGIPVILYAEGNRSFNGRTGFISPRTGDLVKHATGSLITYRIDGAYMQTPRWGHTLRKGPIFGQVVREYSRAELSKMTSEEIYAHICEDLYSDAYAYQREHLYKYKDAHRAEYLETTLFVCPSCGCVGALKSAGNTFGCSCGMRVTVNEYGFFEGEGVRFDNVYDWDMWQRGELKRLADAARGTHTELTHDDRAVLYHVNGNTKALLGENLRMTIYGDSLSFEGDTTHTFPIEDVSAMGVAHTSFLYFTCAGEYYEVRNATIWPANKYFALHRMIRGMRYV
ncbi:MAG: 1-acyl-sn-glycerol-3-phosphate acyltransferase [Clostridia bacterium]|nr:1-acyl-sn-glycerol-3-phosphate acyltransferase [Clostridia bacterium]